MKEQFFRRGRLLRIGLIASAAAILSGAASEELLPVLMGLAVIIITAKIGGDFARRLGQPAVLGELCAGILLGNLDLIGFAALEPLTTNSHLEIIAQLGVLLLLFEVGLESTVRQMLQTGVSSLFVAFLGIVTPMALGFFASELLLPAATWHTHVFVGATLTATSVGITARVLKDLGRSRSMEARTILGAAVIDDVLGLVVLSVVTGAIVASNDGGTFTVMNAGAMLAQALLFLVGAIVTGLFIMPRIFSYAAWLGSSSGLLAVSLSFCFALSWTATVFGLAPIIGAFAAGLVLEESHLRDFSANGRVELEDLIRPLVAFLAPVFFVTMGMHTDLSVFADKTVLLMAFALVVVAIVGKLAASLGVVGGGVSRLTVGIGMVPRGEVGLIFAGVGQGLALADGTRVLAPSLFSALVIVVLVTTMITPPLLKWSTARDERSAE